MKNLPTFDPNTMELSMGVSHVAVISRVVCRPGYYRDSEKVLTIPTTTKTSAKLRDYEVNCTGERSFDGDPGKFKLAWNTHTPHAQYEKCSRNNTKRMLVTKDIFLWY